MGKGLRIIQAMYPDNPVPATGSATGAWDAWVCRCGMPVRVVEILGGWSYVCDTHGQIGVRLDYGELDLGLVRKSPPGVNNFAMFVEQFETVVAGGVDFGFYRDGHWWSGSGEETMEAAMAPDADLHGMAAAGTITRRRGAPPFLGPWLGRLIRRLDRNRRRR